MLNFDEKKVLEKANATLAKRGEIEKVVDQICKDGYKNLFLVGIGGTYSYNLILESIMKTRSNIDVHVEIAAEFLTATNKTFTKDSIVVISSATGNTVEVNKSVEFAQSKGAKVIGFVQTPDSVLAKTVDFCVTYESEVLIPLYIMALRFMKNANEFAAYDKFMDQFTNKLPAALIDVAKASDKAAEEYANKYFEEPIQYLIGAGNLWGETYCYAMCVMEEMQWMKTKSVHAAEFFHGTLEVIERGVSVVVFQGEDECRSLSQRVIDFVPQITDKVTVFDTKDYELKGIDCEFRGLLSPFVIGEITGRVSAYLVRNNRHPIKIRRYYRKLDY